MNHNYTIRSSINFRTPRRGVALVAVVVLFVISLTLFGMWAQVGVREHRQLANERFRLQAVRLAEAGMRRARARHATDPQYREETWSVPAEQLDKVYAGEVRIRVTPTADAAAMRYEATAVFPVDALRRAQITKRIEIPNPVSGDEA